MAEKKSLELILTDGPPGVGCPVIASIGGANMVLIVTEPMVSGKHDLERVAQLSAHFSVPAMICVNKFDLNRDTTREIERFAKEKGLTFLGKIPFDPIFTKAMVQGQIIFEYNSLSDAGNAVREIWTKIRENLELWSRDEDS